MASRDRLSIKVHRHERNLPAARAERALRSFVIWGGCSDPPNTTIVPYSVFFGGSQSYSCTEEVAAPDTEEMAKISFGLPFSRDAGREEPLPQGGKGADRGGSVRLGLRVCVLKNVMNTPRSGPPAEKCARAFSARKSYPVKMWGSACSVGPVFFCFSNELLIRHDLVTIHASREKKCRAFIHRAPLIWSRH